MADGELAEILVFRDQNALLLDAERDELLIAGARVGPSP